MSFFLIYIVCLKCICFMKITVFSLIDRNSPIQSVKFSRTDFSTGENRKSAESGLSIESLPSQDSEGAKLIVPAVAKVSQPCVILIGLMPTSYSATHPLAASPRPALFLRFFPASPPSPLGRLAIWKFPAGRMCRILRAFLR